MPYAEFAIPRLSNTPFDPKAVSATDEAWLKRMGLQTSDPRGSGWLIGGSTYVSLTWSNLPERASRIGVDLLTSMGIFDDICDQVIIGPQQIRDYLAPVFALTWDPDDSTADHENPLARTFVDLWSRASSGRSDHWRRRAQGHWREFLNGWIIQADWRESGTRPNLYTFWEARRQVLGVRVMLDYLEAACGYEIDPRVINHLTIRRLCDLSVDVVFLVNDTFSYEREKHFQEANNFLMVLERERNWSLDQAVGECQRLVREAYREFHRLRSSLRQIAVMPGYCGEKEWEQLEHYIGMWHDIMRGNYDWHLFMFELRERYCGNDFEGLNYLEQVLPLASNRAIAVDSARS
ncbi:hypothetical protein C5L14_24800 [Labrys okinawensis]|uniref:Terpene synthase n=1 Tax=Labrys okinawensis TaxID=346911 RepID=A0A2S9Q656_9HYPH|nr:terpene synthase family protein [Labrys okinawensis]PRH84764.1 hypothetical protein C5L14_24800 [Labrys okinawensis]